MRRAEFEIKDIQEIENFIKQEKTAVLSLVDKNKPYSIPLNFIYLYGYIYFHGADQGKKNKIIRENNNAQFTIYKEYSFIPSYFTGNDMSCSASQFFKSVMISGKLIKSDDRNKIIQILEELMKKYQPEGKYKKIDLNDKMLNETLSKTAIFMLKPDNISAKYKFGQNLNDDKIKTLIDNLKKRGDPIDLETIEMINMFRH